MSQQTPTAPVRRRGRGMAIALCLALMSVLFVPGQAGAASTETISGTAVPSDCNNGRGLGALEFSGDLEGCLIFFPTNYTCTELNGFAHYYEEGREIFRGKYKGERGRFRTKYTLDATYTSGSCEVIDDAVAGNSDFPFDRQLTGGCEHAIKGRTGAFRGLKGLFYIEDVIPEPGVSGATDFLYFGYLG